MKIDLHPHHQKHILAIGVPNAPPELEVSAEDYEHAVKMWESTGFRGEDLHTKVVGHLAWKHHHRQRKEAPAPAPPLTNERNWEKWYLIAIGILLIIVLLSVPAHCQFSKIKTISVTDGVTTLQSAGPFSINFTSGCTVTGTGSAWSIACTGGVGGSGTVTSVSDLAPLFTTATRTTTPAFSLTATAAHAILGNNTAGSAAPTYFVPACASLSDFGAFCNGTAYANLTGVPSTFAPTAHNLLSASHGDTTASAAVRGGGIFALGASPAWTQVAHSATAGGYWKWNGTDVVASSLAAAGTGTPTACSNQFVTSLTLSADAAPTSACTTATLASAQFANQGTTATLLHGNAAGNPAFGAVVQGDVTNGYDDLSSNQTVAGNKTFTGSTTACVVNNVLYVGTGCTSIFTGADIGAQINSAYASASCPSTGCTISIIPVSGGYSFTTPILLNTRQKPAPLICDTAGGSKTGPVGGSCLLNYTPTTATTAITIDYLDTTGSGGTSYTVIRDIALSNNGCVTAGGCASSAIGVLCGATNAGCGGGEFSNFHVSGFSEGVKLTVNVGWGTTFRNSEFLTNTTGLHQTVPQENTSLFTVKFLLNGTALQLDAASEVYSESVSWDGNTTVAINCGGSAGLGLLGLVNNHFENPALGTSHYITGNSCIPTIQGGSFAEDNTTGTTDYMIQTAGFSLSLDHPTFISAGRTFTSAPIQANTPQVVNGTVINGSPAIICCGVAGVLAGTYSTSVSNLKVININSANGSIPQQVDISGFTVPNGNGLRIADNTSAHVYTISYGPNVCANDFWCVFSNTGSKTLTNCALLTPWDCQFPGSIKPATASVGDVGTSSLPWANVWATAGVHVGSTPPACTAGTGGMWCATEGTAPTNVASTDAIYADSTTHEFMAATAGASAATPGMMVRVQPSPINNTAKTAAVTTATLCAASAGACNVAGQYRVSYNFWGSGTACSSVTAGSVGLNLTWTDANAVAHTTITMPMAFDQKAAAAALLFNFNTALGTEGASGSYVISTNGTIIQYATTYTACTTGTGTYNFRIAVERLQ